MTGIEDCIRRLQLFEAYIDKLIEDDFDWFGTIVTDEIKSDHPYIDRTGELTKSIGYEIRQSGNLSVVTVQALISYAEAVEFGTAKSRPYPFFYPKWYFYVPVLILRLQSIPERAMALAAAQV